MGSGGLVGSGAQVEALKVEGWGVAFGSWGVLRAGRVSWGVGALKVWGAMGRAQKSKEGEA